jgi:hypothetical protein
MTLHPAAEAMLRAMPWVGLRRAPLRERGRYYHDHAAVLVRHGLRGGAYNATLMHELVHAERGDEPCVDAACEARQELIVAKEAARRLINIHRLADVAVAFPDDPHRVAEELDVDYDTLAVRVKWLHPSERHYLRRRLAALEGDEVE